MYAIRSYYAAENLAKRYNISREEQDEFALLSHHKAESAWLAGKFDKDIVPVNIPQRGGQVKVFDHDETYRGGLRIEDLEKLRPAFVKDGTVTAGNASPLNDGAAAVMVMTDRITSYNVCYTKLLRGIPIYIFLGGTITWTGT